MKDYQATINNKYFKQYDYFSKNDRVYTNRRLLKILEIKKRLIEQEHRTATIIRQFISPTINWNKEEIGFQDFIDGLATFRFMKIQLPGYDTLKHITRIACLKCFESNYLKDNLPNCLQRYLGIV